MDECLKSTFTGVRLSERLENALDQIIEHRYQQAPLLPSPTKSDVLRALIAEEYKRISLPGQGGEL